METIFARLHPNEFNYVRETEHFSGYEYGPSFFEHARHSIPGCTLLAVGVVDGVVHRAWFLESYVPGLELCPFDPHQNREPLPTHFLVCGDSVQPDARSKRFNPAHNETRYCTPLLKRPDRWLGRWEQHTTTLIVIRAGVVRRLFRFVQRAINWLRGGR